MPAYYFRAIDDDNLPTGFIGLACANSLAELFWCIDEFCDPYRIEVCSTRAAAICFNSKALVDEVGETCIEFADPEVSEGFLLANHGDCHWRKPKWPIHL
jgi:hypothetical protein